MGGWQAFAKKKFDDAQRFQNSEVVTYNTNIRNSSGTSEEHLLLREGFMSNASFGSIFQSISKTVSKENAILLSTIINDRWREIDTKIRAIKERTVEVNPTIRQGNKSEFRQKRLKDEETVLIVETSFAALR